MPMPRSRSGFTLIEILCAMGAFILVFLTGSGGLMRLMMTQTINQQRTVAASAAMLLADWHTTKSVAASGVNDFETDIDGTIADVIGGTGTVSTLTNVKWRGTKPDSTEKVYTFKTSAAAGPYALADLNAYQQLIFTVSTSAGDASSMNFQVVSFWYGDPLSATTNTSDTFEFLGSYLMPDRKP